MSTHNKVIIAVFIIVLLGLGLAIFLDRGADKMEKEAIQPTPATELSQIPSRLCYVYEQEATSAEPYAVEEHVVLDLLGLNVTGTKEGTQSGPDMQNGYSGTLSGTMEGDMLELTYSYIIEGSAQKELEIYRRGGNEVLVKMRHPLTEIDGVLVPDRSSEPKLLTYNQEPCPQTSTN